MTHSKTTSRVPPPVEVTQVVEHLFRHEAGKMVSTLTRIFGIENLNRAEDIVQEALARALQTWPYYGVPRNPAAWLTQVSKNLALDLIRREKVFRIKESEISRFLTQGSVDPSIQESSFVENEIKDDRLRMMFVCCHPLVPQEAQVALALKTLCGFSAAEIARAFLTSEAALIKRLTRAKQRIREARIPIVALNRAVAVANVHGPTAGRTALEAMRHRGKLSSYYLLYAALGEFEAQLNHLQAAADYFRGSLQRIGIKSERGSCRKESVSVKSRCAADSADVCGDPEQRQQRVGRPRTGQNGREPMTCRQP